VWVWFHLTCFHARKIFTLKVFYWQPCLISSVNKTLLFYEVFSVSVRSQKDWWIINWTELFLHYTVYTELIPREGIWHFERELRYLLYQSNRSFNILPPGNPPGIGPFEDWLVQITSSGQKNRSNAPPISTEIPLKNTKTLKLKT